MSNDYNLERFVAAQVHSYQTALAEIKNGRKVTHWIWYIFPQIAGLGRSPTAQHYAIKSLEEAKTYLADPVLGPRLEVCVKTLQALPPTLTAEAIFGETDAMKLRSCLTLFIEAGAPAIFREALKRWYHGQADSKTLGLLAAR